MSENSSVGEGAADVVSDTTTGDADKRLARWNGCSVEWLFGEQECLSRASMYGVLVVSAAAVIAKGGCESTIKKHTLVNV